MMSEVLLHTGVHCSIRSGVSAPEWISVCLSNACESKLCCALSVCSSLQEQKEDLRKRLSYTTHKLELLESEFDSTRQYLETELRRAQEELDKFTDKLRRIQSSYSALQRINQDLEDKIHRTVSQRLLQASHSSPHCQYRTSHFSHRSGRTGRAVTS
ncbi:hypothetical protein NFI96_005284 [Prochilodus magdalenae]|nr:hypothetical protein NFI96_005284 [Prochilodus magdalenae]